MKQVLKRGLLNIVSGATARTAVLLPAGAASESSILAMCAPYRAPGDTLTYEMRETAPGALTVACITETGAAPGLTVRYEGPCLLDLALADGVLSRGGAALGSISGGGRVASRRFSLRFQLQCDDGSLRTRHVGHYVPRAGEISASYFSGEDYRDYEAESQSVHQEIVRLARAHAVHGPVLEVGCATGGTLEALRQAGFPAYGIDISPWAVERARARVGNVVWQGDVENGDLPSALAGTGPFGTIVLASVLEHFADPRQVLERLTGLAAPGATVILITTNADSLTHRIFEGDWEGYFDWTHKGVETVSAQSLRVWLATLGWRITELRTWHIWTGSTDPTHATLRDWWDADARFRTLLAERELGDFITCVAVRA